MTNRLQIIMQLFRPVRDWGSEKSSSTIRKRLWSYLQTFPEYFYPPAQYRKLSMTLKVRTESFMPVSRFWRMKLSESCRYSEESSEYTGTKGRWNRRCRVWYSLSGYAEGFEKGFPSAGETVDDQRRRDVASEALQFRFTDSGNGKWQDSWSKMRNCELRSKVRNRNKCDKAEILKKACYNPLSGAE